VVRFSPRQRFVIVAVADPHALVWALLGEARLTPAARAAMTVSSGDRVAISAITLVEILWRRPDSAPRETVRTQRVVSHSMRGLNATLRLTGGATDDTITKALGHVDISTTNGSYIAPGARERVEAPRAFGRLLPFTSVA
jgi:hypothetical protein